MDQSQLHATSILDLPSRIRHKIYYEAEITRDCFISLAPGNNGYRDETTYSLLLTCRKVYEEVAAELYGNNITYIRYSDQNSLEALKRLGPIALRALTDLTIHLSDTPCGLGKPCGYRLYPWSMREADKVDPPLSKSSSKTRLDEWHSLWHERLLPTALDRPTRLRFSLVCDVADLETARLLVRPLLEVPCQSLLLDCSIRLNGRPMSDLSTLARETVAKVVSKPNYRTQAASMSANQLPFRFTDLPSELRHYILTYTDLVTPYTEVEWNADHGYYCRDVPGGPGNLYPHLLHGESFAEDNADTDDEVEVFEDYPPTPAHYIACGETSFPRGCFCPARHAAFSSSVHCNCWAPPKAYFLVNRSVREDALCVFYGRNRIVVTPASGKTWEAVSTPPRQLPPSIFLRQVMPKDALRFLRSLEIVFPPFGEDAPCEYCLHESPQSLEWLQTLKRIKPHLNLSKLTICVYFAEWQPRGSRYGEHGYRDRMTNKQSRDIYMNYMHTIGPLCQLRGLGRYFVHFAWPKEWVARRTLALNYRSAFLKKREVIRALESKEERFVMGNEYNSVLAGKFDQEESRWHDDHERRSFTFD